MKVLLLCASHNDLGLVYALRKLGYQIIVTGNIPGLIGEKYADVYIKADYSMKEKILEIAKREKVDAICACCNDYGVYTAAYVAEKLGLPGYDSYETTQLLHNKDKFKKFAKKNNIISPWTEAFESYDMAINFLKNVSFPVIVKPTDASAGNGIKKIESFDEGEKALRAAFEKTRVGRIVIEQFIEGSQHGFCTFLINQKVAAVCSNNEYSLINPYRVEIDTYPADNYEKVADLLIEQIEKIASLLQLKDGIFHLQYIYKDGIPQIIEVMRRVLGNMYFVPGNLLTGINWEYWEARARCGLSCEHFPRSVCQEGFYAYKTILSNKNGEIESVEISSRYAKYLVGECILKEKGDKITHYESEPVGFLFFMFASQEEMNQILIGEYDNSIVRIRDDR